MWNCAVSPAVKRQNPADRAALQPGSLFFVHEKCKRFVTAKKLVISFKNRGLFYF